MTKYNFYVDPDICKAETLPAVFYRDEKVFNNLKEKVFIKSWQWIGDQELLSNSGAAYPFVLHDGFLTEPLVAIRNKKNNIACLSNVCTHRGNIIVHEAGQLNNFTCKYHGRQFNLDGTFKSMPEFEQAENFPRACDSLRSFPIEQWGPLLFTALEPTINFDVIKKALNERVGFLPIHEFQFDSTLSKNYRVNCHWALYCDNYLEGFHIPFVHADLNKAIDYGAYSTHLYDHLNLQIGYADSNQEVFDLPKNHIDYGKQIAAYYYWVFPNMMFNFYPWGLSLNIVHPQSLNKTKVSFRSYIYDRSKLYKGAGSGLDKVEKEDEFVVEGVQKGLKSRYYNTGRFSPTREKGVHHFHGLLAKYLDQ